MYSFTKTSPDYVKASPTNLAKGFSFVPTQKTTKVDYAAPKAPLRSYPPVKYIWTKPEDNAQGIISTFDVRGACRKTTPASQLLVLRELSVRTEKLMLKEVMPAWYTPAMAYVNSVMSSETPWGEDHASIAILNAVEAAHVYKPYEKNGKVYDSVGHLIIHVLAQVNGRERRLRAMEKLIAEHESTASDIVNEADPEATLFEEIAAILESDAEDYSSLEIDPTENTRGVSEVKPRLAQLNRQAISAIKPKSKKVFKFEHYVKRVTQAFEGEHYFVTVWDQEFSKYELIGYITHDLELTEKQAIELEKVVTQFGEDFSDCALRVSEPYINGKYAIARDGTRIEGDIEVLAAWPEIGYLRCKTEQGMKWLPIDHVNTAGQTFKRYAPIRHYIMKATKEGYHYCQIEGYKSEIKLVNVSNAMGTKLDMLEDDPYIYADQDMDDANDTVDGKAWVQDNQAFLRICEQTHFLGVNSVQRLKWLTDSLMKLVINPLYANFENDQIVLDAKKKIVSEWMIFHFMYKVWQANEQELTEIMADWPYGYNMSNDQMRAISSHIMEITLDKLRLWFERKSDGLTKAQLKKIIANNAITEIVWNYPTAEDAISTFHKIYRDFRMWSPERFLTHWESMDVEEIPTGMFVGAATAEITEIMEMRHVKPGCTKAQWIAGMSHAEAITKKANKWLQDNLVVNNEGTFNPVYINNVTVEDAMRQVFNQLDNNRMYCNQAAQAITLIRGNSPQNARGWNKEAFRVAEEIKDVLQVRYVPTRTMRHLLKAKLPQFFGKPLTRTELDEDGNEIQVPVEKVLLIGDPSPDMLEGLNDVELVTLGSIHGIESTKLHVDHKNKKYRKYSLRLAVAYADRVIVCLNQSNKENFLHDAQWIVDNNIEVDTLEK